MGERALDGYDIMVNGTKGAVDSAIAKAIVSAGAQPHIILKRLSAQHGPMQEKRLVAP